MEEKIKIRTIYRIDGGILDGTEIEPLMAFVMVRYPHRKTPDLYVPPMKTEDKEVTTWHCCQDNCPNPDFEGKIDALVEHIKLHKGRLVRPWSKKKQHKTPLPAVKLPPNPYAGMQGGINPDIDFFVGLYIKTLKSALKKQGIEILEVSSPEAKNNRGAHSENG
jgi:hypothetical protein